MKSQHTYVEHALRELAQPVTHYVKYRRKDSGAMTSATAHSYREAKALERKLKEALYANVEVVSYAEFWGRS